MPNTSEYHKISCPSCGAPLELTGPQVKCPFCGTVVERPAPPPAPPAKQVIEVRLPFGTQAPAVRPRTGGCVGLGVVITALIIAGVAAVAILLTTNREVAREVTGVMAGPRQILRSPILVPADRAGPADLLLLTRDSSSTYLTYLDGAQHTLRWDSPPLSEDAYSARVFLGRDIYVIDGATLLALQRADGKLAWQTNLADTVPSYCQDCLQLAGNYVVVLSQDGTLQSFEALSGRPAWSQRLNGTPRALWVMDDKVAVLDQEVPKDWQSVAFQLRDPATGEIVQSFHGRCANGYNHEVLDLYGTTVLVSPTDRAAFFLFGITPACALRWNGTGDRPAWQTTGEDLYFDRFTAPPILADGTIYGASDHKVIAVDTQSGDLRTLVDNEDYELTALAVRDGILLVQARRTRGSERYELWGLDAKTGQLRWQYLLQEKRPMSDSSAWADSAWDWHITSQGLVLVHLLPEPPVLMVETLDLQTGMTQGPAASELGDDHWDGIAWSDSTVWVVIQDVYAVDLGTGKILYRWP